MVRFGTDGGMAMAFGSACSSACGGDSLVLAMNGRPWFDGFTFSEPEVGGAVVACPGAGCRYR